MLEQSGTTGRQPDKCSMKRFGVPRYIHACTAVEIRSRCVCEDFEIFSSVKSNQNIQRTNKVRFQRQIYILYNTLPRDAPDSRYLWKDTYIPYNVKMDHTQQHYIYNTRTCGLRLVSPKGNRGPRTLVTFRRRSNRKLPKTCDQALILSQCTRSTSVCTCTTP